jgi:MFS family permease
VRPTRRQARNAFAVLSIINILNYADRSVLSAVLPKIQHDFVLNNTELGVLASSFLIIYALTTLPLGIWADRGVRKNIVALCVAIWSVATTLVGLTSNFLQLLGLRTVLGIGEAGYAPASLSLIGDYFSKTHRARVLSFWSIGNLIGTALGLVLGGIIADRFGWRWAFYIVGLPGLITAFLIWRATEPKRGAFEEEETQGELTDESASTVTVSEHGSLSGDFWLAAQRLFHIPTYWILLGAFIFSFFTIGSASVWIPSFIHEAFHLSVARSSIISGGVLAGGSLVGTLLGGWLADTLQHRLPQGRMIVSTFALLVGAPITLIALSIHTIVPFVVVFIVAIICLSLCLGPLNAIIQDVIAPQVRATAIGLILLLAHLFGDAASPIIVGAIADSYNAIYHSQQGLGFALLITSPICLALAGFICLLGIRTVAQDMRRMQQSLQKQ